MAAPCRWWVTGGQRNDGAMLQTVLDDIHVPRLGPGRARSRPDAVLADRGDAGGVIRRHVRERGIKTVISGNARQHLRPQT